MNIASLGGFTAPMDSTQNLVEAARKLITNEETVAESIKILTCERSSTVESSSKHKSREVTRYSSKSTIHTRHKSSMKAYLFFLATFAIWMVSLLIVYLPISGLMTPTFPFIINHNTMSLFLIAATLAVITSLTLGLNRLRDKG